MKEGRVEDWREGGEVGIEEERKEARKESSNRSRNRGKKKKNRKIISQRTINYFLAFFNPT